MQKKVDSKIKQVPIEQAPIEMFDIKLEAERHYPVGSSKSTGAVPTYRRPKSSGGSHRFSSFRKA